MGIYQLLKNRQHRERLKEILQVFFEEEFGYIITKIKLNEYLPFRKRIRAYVAEQKTVNPEARLRQAFERLGPTFVKFGQLLSLRPDLLPPKYIAEFEKMQDHVPLFPFSEAKKIIEEELKQPLGKIFTSFDPKPIASASISQVYKAKLGGKNVAVKVQRPGIGKTIASDIEIMYQLADSLETEIPELQPYHLKGIIHEFEKWTLKELNFTIEAYYAKQIKKNFQGSKILKIPDMYDQFTTGKVLTMEFLEGIPLHDIKRIKEAKINLNKVIKNGYYIILKQVFVDGFFHADPHPGNILVMKDGKIGLIDFGILGHFDRKLKQYALDLFRSFVNNDPEKTVEVILRMNPQAEVDKEAFREEIRDVFEQLHGTSFDDLELGALVREVLSATSRYHIKVPTDFVLYGKTISIIEGVSLRYQPDFRFFKESKQMLSKLFDVHYFTKEILQKTKDKASEYVDLADRFPETALEIMEKARKFKLNIDIEDKDMRDLKQELERSSGNLALGMIIAALIVGSALMMQVNQGKMIYSAGLALAGILGLWLVQRTIFVRVKR